MIGPDAGPITDHSTPVSPGKVLPCVVGAESEANAPGQGVAQHDPVTHEAVQRVLEGCWTVLLEEEVAYPGKPVAGHGQCQQQPEVGADEGPGQYRQDQQTADVVQAAAHIIAVFAEVERIELGKGAELAAGGGLLDAGIGHGCSPLLLWVCYWILPAGRCRGFAMIPNSCFWSWSDNECIECFAQP